MVTLNQGATSEKIIVTLTELTTISNPVYLFIFQHVTTKEITAFIASNDLSPYPNRYNEFEINTSVVFTKVGQYIYKVYEQASETNTDPTGLNKVENGRMNLVTNAPFAPVVYEPAAATLKEYAG